MNIKKFIIILFFLITNSVEGAQYLCPRNLQYYNDITTCQTNCTYQENCALKTISFAGNTIEDYVMGIEISNNQIKVVGPNSTVLGVIDYSGLSLSSNFTTSNYVNKVTISGTKIQFYKSLTTEEVLAGEMTVSGASMVLSSGTTQWINKVIGKDKTISFYSGTTLVASITFTSIEYVCPNSTGGTCSGTPPKCTVPEVCLKDEYSCAKDANNDNYVDASEIQTCLSTENNYLCPIDKVKCDATTYPPNCVNGTTLNNDTDLCEANPIKITCDVGFVYDRDLDMCVGDAICDSPGILNTNTDRCEISAAGVCPATYSFDSNLNVCAKSPSCSGSGVYLPSLDKCVDTVIYVCPTGSYYNQNTSKCATNPTCTKGVYDPQMNLCFDGYNTCPYAGNPCLLDTDGVKRCSPFTCFNLAKSTLQEESADLTSLQDDGTIDKQGNCSGMVLLFNGQPGECRPSGLKTNYKSCCNPNLSISNLLNVCKESERTTATKVDSGLCHYIGEYCKNKVLRQCVQKARTYCCFSSKLGRIIQEQGRKQLGIGWGDAKNPDCRGFKQDEFSMLDFSKMDFSEFLNDIQTSVYTDIINQSQQNLQDKVQQYVPQQ